MKLLLSSTVFVVLIITASCSKEKIPTHPAQNCDVDYTAHPYHKDYWEALNLYISTSSAPGSVIGIKKNQQEEWIGASGFSNLEHHVKFQVCTPFRCGSITKAFTAVIIMQLFDEGKIELDSKLSELLPSVKDKIPDSDKITIMQLLNHSSGIKHPTDDDRNYQLSLINDPDYIGSMDYKKRLETYIYGKALKHSPGSESYYSNAGYWLLGQIIEKVTGLSIQENLEKRITKPLQLTSTYLAKRENEAVARGYNFSGNRLKDVTLWDKADSDGDPSAGLISNAKDLLHFGEALFKGQLVSDSSLVLMKTITSFPSCNADCGYGLGIETWVTKEYSGYGKNGTSLGFDANLIFFPEKNITILIFSNYGGGNKKDVIDRLLNI